MTSRKAREYSGRIPMLLDSLILPSIILLNFASVVSASLTTSYTGRPCPGEEVILTCTVTGDQLTWESPGEPQILIIRGMAMVNDSGSTLLSGAATVTVISINSTTITSTLTLSQSPIQIPEDGIRFTCVDVGSVTVQNAASPSPPGNFSHSIVSNSAEGASVSVQWDPPTDNGGRDDLNYTVTISPLAQLSATVVTSTSVTVSTADYNEDYTVSVVATNCAGNSTAEEYSFRVGECPLFTNLISNGDFGPVTSRVQGSTVTLQCDPGYVSDVDVLTCEGTLMWSPDPGTVVCRPLTPPPPTTLSCVPPDPPLNGLPLNNTHTDYSEGSVISFQCEPGFSLVGGGTVTCNNSGLWSPDPALLMCTRLPGTVEIAPIAGGVVGGLIAVILVVLIVIIIVVLLTRRTKEIKNSVPVDIEMTDTLQGEYSELRHDGPKKKGSKKSHPAPVGPEEYDRVTHNLDSGPTTYDDITIGSEKKADDGYSKVSNGQGAQRLPGYGQLNNIAPVEAVVYADLGVVTKKKCSEAPEVDQHTVTYSTLDMAATSRMKASTMPAPSKGGSAEQADKLLNLDQALVQLRPVQSRWKELADALRVPETYIQQVNDMYGKDHASSMTEIIDYWMRSCGGRPTWRELADALKRIKEDSLAQQLMSIYDTGRLPVELDMNEVPKELYKYDNAPPPPVPTRSPTITDTDSPGLSRTLPPPVKPPRHGGDHPPPSRPPKPPPKNESPAPPRPPKPPPKN